MHYALLLNFFWSNFEMKQALEVAARCWCDPETAYIVFDVELAKAFAKRLNAVFERLKQVEELLRKGKGTWPEKGYIRDSDWDNWLGEQRALRSIVRSWGVDPDEQ